MAKKLEGKVAVVTGASKGIGAAIARQLGAEGASVVVNYASSKEGADKVVNEIVSKSGKAIAVQGDVSKQADIDKLFAETKKAYKKVDILVNNAGIYEFGPLEAVTEAQFHKIFNLNVLGLLLTTQAAAKHFGEGASVINIGSGVSRITPPNTGLRERPRRPDSPRPRRPTRRHRRRRRLPSLRRFALADRRAHPSRRRPALIRSAKRGLEQNRSSPRVFRARAGGRDSPARYFEKKNGCHPEAQRGICFNCRGLGRRRCSCRCRSS
jgi:NAD(P)-dependent dehydrogenase (short-subunit alcohol dehydrogenase family)